MREDLFVEVMKLSPEGLEGTSAVRRRGRMLQAWGRAGAKALGLSVACQTEAGRLLWLQHSEKSWRERKS